jgi:hypothetical protein
MGMAVAGLMPVPEIQFRKYADSAAEQINDCGSLRWRTANRFAAPMVVRIPGGFFKCGDPWHSQTNEVQWSHRWHVSNAEMRGAAAICGGRPDDVLRAPRMRMAWRAGRAAITSAYRAIRSGTSTVVTWMGSNARQPQRGLRQREI